MKIAMIGLGKMGGNMVRRLRQSGIDVVGFNREKEIIGTLVDEVGMIPAKSLNGAIKQLESPRVVWLMLPCGKPTEKVIKDLETKLSFGDIVVDGGNSNYEDTRRRGAMLAQSGIGLVDAGTSGGVWGLKNGYCMMVGGEKQHVNVIKPLLKALAPAEDRGWAHVGPSGSGHYTKMIHNGIEYGMMQAYAEGFELLRKKTDFDLDLAEISEMWRHGSVVQSWLLDLTAEAFNKDQGLENIAPFVPDSGEGRWTVQESIELGVPAPVITLALQMRFASQDAEGYGNRALSVMRNAFGGHDVKGSDEK